jgi:hypothetical protein
MPSFTEELMHGHNVTDSKTGISEMRLKLCTPNLMFPVSFQNAGES